jgi:hypothetical protein
VSRRKIVFSKQSSLSKRLMKISKRSSSSKLKQAQASVLGRRPSKLKLKLKQAQAQASSMGEKFTSPILSTIGLR